MSAPTLQGGAATHVATERMDAEFVLGLSELSAGRVRDLQRYLTAVIDQRGFPLHLNCLWNALYYGWDLTERGYPLETLNPEVLLWVEMAEQSAALPVGAFGVIQTGRVELLGEVVGKFGAAPGLSLADVPGSLAGAATAGTVVRERLVIDHTAVPGLADVEDRQLDRLRRNARWVDELGHVVHDADYGAVGAADRSDVDFYIEWLLTTHRRVGLLDWAFTGTADLDAADFDAAVAATFDTLTSLLAATPGLVRFGDWSWTEQAYGERARDAVGAHRLGEQELSSLWSIVQSTYGAAVRWRAVELELADLAERWSAAQRGEVLAGVAYLRSVFTVNRYLADRVGEEAREGVITRRGAAADDPPVHVRLDDAWQVGGLWRTEVADVPRWYHQVDPLVALGLGSRGTTPPTGEAAADLAGVDDAAVEVLDEIVEVERIWQLVLTAEDHAVGRLEVPVEVARQLSDGPIAVHVRHRQPGEQAAAQVQRAMLLEGVVTGLAWPGRMMAGTKLWCRTSRTSRIVDVESRLLPEPVDVDGLIVVHHYDRRLVTRAAGRSGLAQLRRAVTAALRQLLGTQAARDAAGRRRVKVMTLAAAVHGEEVRTDRRRLAELLDVLDSLGVRREGLDVVAAADAPLPAAERTAAPLPPTRRAQLATRVRREPRLRLRRLQPGEERADPAAYAATREASGEQAVLPESLGADWTWERSTFQRAGVDGDLLRRIGPVQQYDDDL